MRFLLLTWLIAAALLQIVGILLPVTVGGLFAAGQMLGAYFFRSVGRISHDSVAAAMQTGKTLGELKDDLFNRMREVFELSRIKRVDGACGGYAHHDGSAGVLLEVQGGNAELAI